MSKILNTYPQVERQPLEHALEESLNQLSHALPLHGGDIQSAITRYGIPAQHWIDLSTGINPEPYPVPELPARVYEDLPYWQPSFLSAAEQYYGQKHFLAIPGSQAVIQVLPGVLNEGCGDNALTVMVPKVGYQEHAKQWRLAGNPLNYYRSTSVDDMVADIDGMLADNKRQHLVVIQPNNPTGISIDNHQLCRWASALEAGGCLIVDEAFIDLTPKESLLNMNAMPDNIILSRSFGKFFGLAGIRLGFVFTQATLLDQVLLLDKLREKMGIWQISGPAQYVATVAMSDVFWQVAALKNIASNAKLTEQVFSAMVKKFPMHLVVNAQLFLSYAMPISWALVFNDFLAKAGILTRVIQLNSNQAMLRIGCLNANNPADVSRVKSTVQKLCLLNDLSAVLTSSLEKSV